MTAALEGIKVVDLCSVVSGPVAMTTLADQGADVIKVEGLTGDVTRGAAPLVSCVFGSAASAVLENNINLTT